MAKQTTKDIVKFEDRELLEFIKNKILVPLCGTNGITISCGPLTFNHPPGLSIRINIKHRLNKPDILEVMTIDSTISQDVPSELHETRKNAIIETYSVLKKAGFKKFADSSNLIRGFEPFTPESARESSNPGFNVPLGDDNYMDRLKEAAKLVAAKGEKSQTAKAESRNLDNGEPSIG
jgi:hypothetical protein